MKIKKGLNIWGVVFFSAVLIYSLSPNSAHTQSGEELLDDAVRGAAKGALIGGIAGDAGKGAAAGAVGAALFGGMRR